MLIMMGDGGDESQNYPFFHDFLGVSISRDGQMPSPHLVAKGDDSGAADVDAAFALLRSSSSGHHGLVSPNSSIVPERQGMKSSEVFHFHGRKTALSGLDVDSTLSGHKRSSSGSVFPGLVDRVLPVHSDSLQSSFLIKRPPRPTSIILHPPSSRPESPFFQEEPSFSKGPGHQTSRFSQYGTCFDLVTNSYAYKDGNAVATIISQSSSDDGSRTGIRKARYLSIENPINIAFEGNSTGFLHRTKSSQTIESEPSSISRSSAKASAGRQMTIFYAGQAHVFDNVHPNKAHVIMALAGVNSGSWSHSYPPKTSEWMPIMTEEATRQTIGDLPGNHLCSMRFGANQSVKYANMRTQFAEPNTATTTTAVRDKRET